MTSEDTIFSTLNDKQREAVLHINGPLLILAGAGSGKTKTLTHRIAHMIATGISAHEILAITFTNKAANEMKERIKTLLYERDDFLIPPTLPTIGTFHAVCLRILRREAEHLGYRRSFAVFDPDDQERLVKNILEELQLNPKKWTPSSLLNKISKLKSELRSPDWLNSNAKEFSEKILLSVYIRYQDKLKQLNAMDFDDLIMKLVELFQKKPEILDNYQNIFKYILVDEYQDTNKAQYVWVNLLAKKHRNLAVIGDDAQSIYGWRQADMRNILDFEKDYPEAKTILLEQNYRSTQIILEAANHVISKNSSNRKKNLWTDKNGGAPIIVKELSDEHEEAEYIAEHIKEQMKQGRLHGFAVLYRTHAQSRAIEEVLIRRGIPYRIVGAIQFYQRREVKDIIGYLRLALNPDDFISFERIYNVPTRGIGDTSYEKFKALNVNIAEFIKNPLNIEDLDLPKKAKSNFLELFKILSDFSEKSETLNPSQLIAHITKTIDFEAHLKEDKEKGDERWENVRELMTASSKYEDEDNKKALEQFLEEVSLLQTSPTNSEAVIVIEMLTIHSAKGLEFPVVFVVGLEEGIFPSGRAMYSTSELEEERRLCYVAITRARELLYLTFCQERMLYGSRQSNAPSRFINEIPKHLITFIDSYSGKPKQSKLKFAKEQNKKRWQKKSDEDWEDIVIDYD